MSIESNIDVLINKLIKRGTITDKSKLYTEQVKAKIKNVRFCLATIGSIENTPVNIGQEAGTTMTAMAQAILTQPEKIGFYCETFFDFLRSSIDILGQVINEVSVLGIPERGVDIKQASQALDTQKLNTPIQKSVKYFLSLKAFKNLEDYRNCSMHNRQIFIETQELVSTVLGTSGYNAVSSQPRTITYASHICSNPWDVVPDVKRDQDLYIFLTELLAKLEQQMSAIVNHL